MRNESKISSSHLERNAYVYIRQSTEHQVKNNLESKQRQYELTGLAERFGWHSEKIVVIDDDLGCSGSTARGRGGFEKLVAEVALKKAGIVLGIEVSRLARNNRDWYELLDLCALTGTLIADSDGIYDTCVFNDRLLLGLKGTMSEAELHILRGRMLEGLLHKARKGELKFGLPAGYVHGEDGRIVKSPDERIRHTIELVFEKYFRIGSVYRVLRDLLDEELDFPRKSRSDKQARWVRPYYKAIRDTLINPIYAGAYVFGKSKMIKELDEHGKQRSRQVSQDMKDWEVIIQDHHPGYISWDDHLRIRRIMERNRAAEADQASSVTREGAALLQGLAHCGKCGRAMRVGYQSRNKISLPNYICRSAVVFGAPVCQMMGGRRIDEEVARLFLEEMAPARIGIHLEALRSLREQQDGVLEQFKLDLERAQYDAARIGRQFDEVEPENRLVARTLEKQWNEALKIVEEKKQKLSERERFHTLRLTNIEESQIKRLSQDLPALWFAPSTMDRDRKQLLRAALEEVQVLKVGHDVHLKIVWRGGAMMEHTVHLPRIPGRTAVSDDFLDLLRKLTTRHTDKQIARIMLRKGLKTPMGMTPTAHRIASIRLHHGIECFQKRSDEEQGTYTVDQAAEIFNVSRHTILLWLKEGLLRGDQLTSCAPWAVYVSEEDKGRLRENGPAGWLPIEKAAMELRVSKQTVVNWVKEGKVAHVYVTKGRRRGLRIDVKSTGCGGQHSLFS